MMAATISTGFLRLSARLRAVFVVLQQLKLFKDYRRSSVGLNQC